MLKRKLLILLVLFLVPILFISINGTKKINFLIEEVIVKDDQGNTNVFLNNKEQSIGVHQLEEKPDDVLNAYHQDHHMENYQHNKRKIEELWVKLLLYNNDDLAQLNDTLLSLRDLGAGWILYEDIFQKLESQYFDDKIVVYLLKILLDAYEGGSIETQSYQKARNYKDEIIQLTMRNQLNIPSGKESFKYVLRLLYYLQSDDKDRLLEESIALHPNLLTKVEKLSLRLHYSSFKPDRLAEVIDGASNDSNEDAENSQLTILENLEDSLLLEKNGLLSSENDNLRLSLLNYLEKNPVNLNGYNNLSLDKKVKLSTQYAKWVWAYGAANEEKNLDNYFYNSAKKETDPVKLLSLINYQRSRVQITENTKEILRLLDDQYIKEKLNDALFDSKTDKFVKLQIKEYVDNYYNVQKNQ